jgi:hypothetical protein
MVDPVLLSFPSHVLGQGCSFNLVPCTEPQLSPILGVPYLDNKGMNHRASGPLVITAHPGLSWLIHCHLPFLAFHSNMSYAPTILPEVNLPGPLITSMLPNQLGTSLSSRKLSATLTTSILPSWKYSWF